MDIEERVQQLEEALAASELALAYAVAPLIAAHPKRDELLHHLSQYRGQVVGSRDPVKAKLSEVLTRLDHSVRFQAETWQT